MEAAKKKASDLSKEAKETKEEMRPCRMDRDYHVEVANKKFAINDDLQGKLQASTTKCEQLSSEVESLKDSHAKTLSEMTEELEDTKDAIKVCFYMF